MRKNDFIFATGLFVLLGILVFLVFFDNAARAATHPVVSVYGGESIMNSLNDAKSTSYQVDQTNHIGTTIGGYRYGSDFGYLNLGHASIGHGLYLKTDGIFALYRVSDRVGNISTFAGVGPYLFAVTVPTGLGTYQDRYGAALMTAAGLQYRLGDWRVRASWERETTFRSLDEDVILLGVGHTL